MTRRSLLCGFVSATVALAQPDHQSVEKKLFTLVNEEREKRGLGVLRWNEAIAGVARAHSGRMADSEFFAHQDPEIGDLRARLERGNVAWQRCAENLFRERGYPSVVEPTITGWLQNPSHQANLLTPDYTISGMGVAVSKSETYYVTQVFVKHE